MSLSRWNVRYAAAIAATVPNVVNLVQAGGHASQNFSSHLR